MILLDKIADWLRHSLGSKAQLRLGVAILLGTVPIYIYLPFSKEPPVIYALSVLALTLTGIAIVVGAENLDKGED